MVKGDDALAKKRNKATRKKIRRKEGSTSSAVSARVASLIASKKRRKAGVRRKCQGMCFSLPNPEDPFNDKLGKGGAKKKDTEKAASLVGKPHREEESGLKLGKRKTNAVVNAGDVRKQPLKIKAGDLNRPSKFLTLCLNAIEKSMHDQSVYGNNGEERPLFVDSWGVEFLKCYLSGENVLETSGVPCTTEQIAWIVSVAADTITRKEKEGLSIATPFLLFLVPSQEKATKVRKVCKPLKALGIHSVSLHSGASVDHQMQGLKSCEPEFLVSTPDRLIELISWKAIDVSGVSFLVIDGVGYLNKDMDSLKSIVQSISEKPFSVVFDDSLSSECPSALQNLLSGSVHRLPVSHSIQS